MDAVGNIYIADTNNQRTRVVMKSTGIMTTVAGDGVAGFSGDRGSARSARLNAPRNVAVDAAGNIYIADTNNHRIRIVMKSTCVINTVASTSVASFTSDGDLAKSRTFNSPRGIALVVSGNICIADTFNNRVRVVIVTTGIITTMAKGVTKPNSVTVDAAGNICICESPNGRILMKTKSTGPCDYGTVSGYAGDGHKLYRSQTVVVDSSGKMYIADTFDNRIRKVTKSTRVIF